MSAANEAQSRVPETPYRIANYTAEIFLSYVEQEFHFQATERGGSVCFKLLRVSRASQAATPPGFRAPFSLLFTLNDSEPVAGGLYQIEHADFEPAPWFFSRVVVPGAAPGIPYYEAVFG